MTKHLTQLFIIFLITMWAGVTFGGSATYSLAIFSGAVFNSKEDLRIKQDGEEDITINNAEFKTKPMSDPPYYGIRLSRWNNNKAWEIEHIHQKLYLDNLPPDVQQFEITDGYNLFLINRAWQFHKKYVVRLGAGTVISHPDIKVRGKTNFKRGGGAIPKIWTDGYRCCGITGQVSLAREIKIFKKIFLNPEIKLTHSRADVPIADGSVQVNNTAVHLNFGLGYNF